jgi:hypothetical protein
MEVQLQRRCPQRTAERHLNERAAFDPVVQQLTVGTHGPDCRPGKLNRPSVEREAEHAVVSAANAPARSPEKWLRFYEIRD